MAAQVYAADPTGLVQVRVRALEPDASLTEERLAARATNASAIRVHRVTRVWRPRALVWGDTLAGVLSLYSSNGGFSDEQIRRVEHLAPATAEFVCRPSHSTVAADGQRHQPLSSCA